jgi:predicted dehydrogenase
MSSLLTPARPRVAVLGVGAMGRLHARVFAELTDHFVLVGVYDPTMETARAVSEAQRVPAFSDESEAIAAADLVIVASPIEAHAGAARRALARGRHVFVEKPVCATATQAFVLARAVARGQKLFVGHSERFNPVVRALHEIVRPSEVRSIRLRRTSTVVRPNREHGALVSLGVHDLDLVAHFTASPVALRRVVYLDDDRADLVLAAARGAVAWVHVDRRAGVRERSVEIETKDALYSGDLLAKTLSVRPHGGASTTLCPLVDEEPLVAQAHAMARALRGSEEAVADCVDGARALALVEEAVARTRTDMEPATQAS